MSHAPAQILHVGVNRCEPFPRIDILDCIMVT
jgi:hypothetical protein